MIDKEKYKLSKDQYIDAYKKILLTRRFEEKAGNLYGRGLIGGFCHLYIGQEAVAAATYIVKNKDDSIITSYRCHAHVILAGTQAKYVLAELLGKDSGCSKGKGGSMHLFDARNKFYGGHGIVGAQVSLGTGLAFAEKYKETNNLCFTFLGDGAINQGQVYESFNMAALWKLPVIYIIENNEYSMGTSVARSTYMTDLYKKGESFGINGIRVNGMDLEETYAALMYATEFVRNNNGPLILEMKTYRYRGHSMSDPAKYRSKEEVEEYKELDVLNHTRNKLLEYNYATEDEIKTYEKSIKNILNDAEEFALNAELPDISNLYHDVLA
jgi:pyruvate dehydrogenase E1 component alpha subunit